MKKYLFVGNRYYVLKKMFNLGCCITKIYAVENSFLEHELKSRDISYIVLPEKKKFIELLMGDDFDVLISNGCPYILPVSKFHSSQKFINIHPSLLPDLKGRSPINGALLFERNHGVTCHYMDDNIDEGRIISQISIPVTEDIDLELLYQISFIAEGECFLKAYETGFQETDTVNAIDNPLYYSRKQEDMFIDRDMKCSDIVRVVRAFQAEGQYAKVVHNDRIYDIHDAEEIYNPYIIDLYKNVEDNEILLLFGNKCLVKINGSIVYFKMEKELRENSKFFT